MQHRAVSGRGGTCAPSPMFDQLLHDVLEALRRWTGVLPPARRLQRYHCLQSQVQELRAALQSATQPTPQKTGFTPSTAPKAAPKLAINFGAFKKK